MKYKLGLGLAGVYVLFGIFLIISQGLLGESFISIVLGIPWSFMFAYFEYWSAEGFSLVLLLLFPVILNAVLFFWIGTLISRKMKD